MLKTKLFQAFAALAIVFGLLSSVIGIQIIHRAGDGRGAEPR